MGYQTTSIAGTLSRINNDLFIPAIQRPFVWAPDQITRLFDSLMRGYPIGGLMFWDLPEGSRDDWEIYYFIKNFRQGSIHNDRANLLPDNPVTLVLDGQQRLTSLLIGLMGTYNIKQKHKRKATEEAWDEKVLYIDLFHSPERDEYDEDDDTSPIAEHYRFEFFDRDVRPHNRLGELWFKVGLIMEAKTEDQRDQLVKLWVDSSLSGDNAGRAIATENLNRLWVSVWQDQAITYFTESSNSYDRVLDIFIRANDGGTRLSRSDLLMSVITLRWETFNAREETEQLIDDLTDMLSPKRAISREFILRTALFLNDLDFSIKVKNFVPSNIRLLEQSWERIKNVLRFSAKFLHDHGLYGDQLNGINVLMLVAYYVHKSNLDDNLRLSIEDQQKIRRWLIVISFQGILGTQTGATFVTYRNAVRRSLHESINFPMQAIANGFNKLGRPIHFTQDSIDRWCNASLGHHQSESLLSLLYQNDLASLQRRMLPLVRPCFFLPEELRRNGVSDALAPIIQNFDQRLILGVALDSREQEHYYEMPFEQWAQILSPDFMEFHCLPKDISLYRMDQLPEWVNERRRLLMQRLLSLVD